MGVGCTTVVKNVCTEKCICPAACKVALAGDYTHRWGGFAQRGCRKKQNIRERVAQGRIPSRQRDKSDAEFKVDRLDLSGPPVDRRCVRSAVKTDVQPPNSSPGGRANLCVCVCAQQCPCACAHATLGQVQNSPSRILQGPAMREGGTRSVCGG